MNKFYRMQHDTENSVKLCETITLNSRSRFTSALLSPTSRCNTYLKKLLFLSVKKLAESTCHAASWTFALGSIIQRLHFPLRSQCCSLLYSLFLPLTVNFIWGAHFLLFIYPNILDYCFPTQLKFIQFRTIHIHRIMYNIIIKCFSLNQLRTNDTTILFKVTYYIN